MIVKIVLKQWKYENNDWEHTNFILEDHNNNTYKTTSGEVREYFNYNGLSGDTFLLDVNDNNEILDIMVFNQEKT